MGVVAIPAAASANLAVAAPNLGAAVQNQLAVALSQRAAALSHAVLVMPPVEFPADVAHRYVGLGAIPIKDFAIVRFCPA